MFLLHERKRMQRSVLRTRGFRFAFHEVEFMGDLAAERFLSGLFDPGPQWRGQPRIFKARQRQMRRERSRFARDVTAFQRPINAIRKRGQFRWRLNTGPNYSRPSLIGKKAEAADFE